MTASISNSNIDNLNIFNNDTPIQSKVCAKCKQIKSITEYSKNKRKLDGLESSFKSCQSIKRKHWHENNKQIIANKIYNENDVKTCSKCKKIKSITNFSKNKINSDWLKNICKSCECIIRINYRNNNRKINNNRIFTENDIKTCLKCKQ